jgi:hypothetical protein
VSGTVSRLRVSGTRHPTALYHMVLFSRRLYADHLGLRQRFVLYPHIASPTIARRQHLLGVFTKP